MAHHPQSLTAATAVQDRQAGPKRYALAQNYPNPFNPKTTIAYNLPQAGWPDLTIYKPLGQRERQLVLADRTAGANQALWDGRDERGHPLASGLYIYHLRSAHGSLVQRMLLLR